MFKKVALLAAMSLIALFVALSPVPGTRDAHATPAQTYTVSLDPSSDTNMIGAEHCVTATLSSTIGAVVQGITMTFAVSGATSGTATPTGAFASTDADGEATFCYTNTTVGTDTITATALVSDGCSGFGPTSCINSNGNPSDTATKTWNLGACTGMVFDKTIFGTTGNDTITASGLRELILGIQGNDVINGGAGNDCIVGGAGNDTLGGGSGNDKLFGDVGNDIVNGDSGTDVGNGGTGTDTCNAESESTCEI